MIHTSRLDSPVGDLFLASRENSLIALTLGKDAEEKLASYLASQFDDEISRSPSPQLVTAGEQLERYFEGDLLAFDLNLEPRGTRFQKLVWSALQEIPYGTTLSYGQLADRLGVEGGMRAVGSANGRNPIPIIIPCHRVIAADGGLGGFTGGLEIKHHLLELERQKRTPTLF